MESSIQLTGDTPSHFQHTRVASLTVTKQCPRPLQPDHPPTNFQLHNHPDIKLRDHPDIKPHIHTLTIPQRSLNRRENCHRCRYTRCRLRSFGWAPVLVLQEKEHYPSTIRTRYKCCR